MTLFRLEVPLAGFRPHYARDYQETFPLPPPSTVFGCLLSFLGIQASDAGPYGGTCVSIAGRTGSCSTILRKMRRDPANPPKGRPRWPASRPEYQELLCDVTLWVEVARGAADRELAKDLHAGLQNPDSILRFGVVSLGESPFMIDSIAVQTGTVPTGAQVLRPTPSGSLNLTTWVDYSNRSHTRHARFELAPPPLCANDAVVVGPLPTKA